MSTTLTSVDPGTQPPTKKPMPRISIAAFDKPKEVFADPEFNMLRNESHRRAFRKMAKDHTMWLKTACTANGKYPFLDFWPYNE